MTNPYQYSDLGAGTLGTSSITNSVTTFAPTSGATAATFPQAGPFDIRISQSGNVELATVGATTGGTSPTWSSITRGIGTPVAIGPFAFTSGAVITQVLTEEGLTKMPLGGDATGPANASTIYSLAAGLITIGTTTAALLFGSTTTPSITQTTVTTAAVDAGAVGQGAVVQAQNGQGTTRDGGAAGNGGSLWLGTGNAGVAGHNGTAGTPGILYMALGDGAVLEIASTTTFGAVTDNVMTWGPWGNQPAAVQAYTVASVFDGGNADLTTATLQQLPGTIYPALEFNSGAASTADVCIYDNGYRALAFDDCNGNFALQFPSNGSGTFVMGMAGITFNPGLSSNVNANANFPFAYAAQSSVSSGAVVGGAVSFAPQPGQATTGNNTAGAGGAWSSVGAIGGASTGTTTAAIGGAGGANSNVAGAGGAGGKDGVGGTGGAGSCGAGAGGAADAGGNGGNEDLYSGAGGAGHSFTGLAGAVRTFVGGPSGTGTLAMSYAATGPAPGIAYPTFSASANTTLTSAQAINPLIDLGAVVTTASVAVVWPSGAVGVWHVDESAVTLGSTDTLTFQANSGATCTAISAITNSTNGLTMVRIKGDGGISCGN